MVARPGGSPAPHNSRRSHFRELLFGGFHVQSRCPARHLDLRLAKECGENVSRHLCRRPPCRQRGALPGVSGRRPEAAQPHDRRRRRPPAGPGSHHRGSDHRHPRAHPVPRRWSSCGDEPDIAAPRLRRQSGRDRRQFSQRRRIRRRCARLEFPLLIFVPFLPLDAESTTQAAFTVQRMRAATPSATMVIVENRYGGAVERIVKGSHAAQSYEQLVDAAKNSPRIVMPAIAREYWAPWEGAGIRFLKALAMDAEEASVQLGRSVGEIKIARSAIARFWRVMHRQVNEIIDLPMGGE